MRLRTDSLAVRVVFFSSLWAAAAIALMGWILIGLYREDAVSGFEDLQDAQLYTLVGAVSVGPDGSLEGDPNLGNTRFLEPLSGWYWKVVPISMAGTRELTSPSLAGSEIDAPPLSRVPFSGQFRRRYVTVGPGGNRVRVLESEIDLGNGAIARFQVAGNETSFEARVGDFARRVILALAVFAIGVLLVNAVILLVGLRPLDRVRKALQDIRNGHAGSLEGRFPSEISPLVDEMNALIDNNKRVVERSRTQVGNLAHSLKTPLSVLVNEAESRTGPSGATVAEQARAMDYQIQHYLKRARIAAQRESIVFRTDAAPVLEKLVAVIRKINPDKKIGLDIESGPKVFAGEKEDFEEIAGNLLENACKWAARTVTIELGHAEIDGRPAVRLAVGDDGPGIAPGEREIALKRGKRLDESVPGTGLGLAIVAETVSAYGGRIELGESAGGGLSAVVLLPAAR